MLGSLLIIGVIAIAIIGIYINIYNRIQTYENRIDEAYAQIDVQLKKRYDLVPNLVETVKGYASHEREIFENVSKARSGLIGGSIQERVEADNQLTRALGRLFAVAEAYPELKASENFTLLQEQLEGIESKVAYARQYYNQTVLDFNNLISTIPGVWFAGGRKEKDFLEITEEQREAPQVKF
jgi:LemA protein